MSVYIFAARIYLDSAPSIANASDIGLYATAGNSEFRWIEADITSYAPDVVWKPSILKPGGIGSITESVDLSRSGNIAQLGGSSVAVGNTLSIGGSFSQLDHILDTNEIRFAGLRCDLYRFEISGGSLVATAGTIIYRGTCAEPNWTEKVFNIPIQSAILKRRSNLSTVISDVTFPDATGELIGQNTPVTFGEYKPLFDADGNVIWNGYAKFIKTSNRESEYKNQWGFTLHNDAILPITVFPVETQQNLNVFPIVGDDGVTPPIQYDLKIAASESEISWKLNDVLVVTGTYSLNYFEGKYLTVVDGSGLGQSRRIESAQVDLDTDRSIIEVTMADYYEEILDGNSTATDDDNSWAKIKEVTNAYSVDVWPCNTYLDKDGNSITQGFDLYSYSSQTVVKVNGTAETVPITRTPTDFLLLPKYAYEDSGNTLNNKIVIDVKQFTNDVNNMDNFYIVPVTDVELVTDPDLNFWGLTGWEKKVDGLYYRSGGSGNKFNLQSQNITGSLDDVTDQNFNSLWQSRVEVEIRNVFWRYAIRYKLPELPSNIFNNFNVYMLARLGTVWGGLGLVSGEESIVKFYSKRFVGNCFSETGKDDWDDTSNKLGNNILSDLRRFENTADFYYSTNPDQQNRWFYWNNGDNTQSFGGYMNLGWTEIVNKDLYNSVKDNCLFSITRELSGSQQLTVLDYIRLYELAIGLKRQINIQREIYIPFQGRIYDDTWGARKTAADMINNPVDILEHTLRLQNWSEQDETADWGHEYAADPLINVTTSEGGFDYVDLNSVKEIRPSRQIFSYSDAWTPSVIRSLCKAFWMVSFQDPPTGNEQVSYIPIVSTQAVSTTVTLADTIGPISTVLYPKNKNIFAEPLIRYAKNNATDNYDGVIQVLNASADTYDPSYIVGLTGGSAELMWARAHTLYEATRQIEKPPSDLVNNDWIVTDGDAINFMDTWLTWMGAINTDGTPEGVEFEPKKRITFTVPYETGKDWFITKHINLQLPHQTNDEAIECIIEKITKNIQIGKEGVTIQVILYGRATEIESYIQDTWDENNPQWVDSYETKAEAPSQGEDVQDMM